MANANYSQIVAALSDVDRKSVRESTGVDVDTGTVDQQRLASYFARRQRALEVAGRQQQPGPGTSEAEWQSVQCSVCRSKHVPYFIKLSEPHVICEGCLDTLVKGAAA
jgi:hypothetical protein